ncbi:MAG TPA: hypothetical protein VM260_24145, partial [Pirellula sp.]|nr:hypothetical protein [Pirellula sp.]
MVPSYVKNEKAERPQDYEMKNNYLSAVAVLFISTSCIAYGQDQFSVEAIDAAPKADVLSVDQLQHFDTKGYLIKSGARTVCELWLAKKWEIDPKFKASKERLYPFPAGQLIGLVHFNRKYFDFRKQTVPSGWYTLRFALQPVDGNHEGTSIIRDFLLLLNVQQDEAEKKWTDKSLFKVSAESIGTTHPAMLSLQSASEGTPSIIHNAEKEFHILHLIGNGIAGEKGQATPLDFVVAGHAPE